MDSKYKPLPIDFHPQRNEFIFDEIKFSSKFDSGNLLNVKQISHSEVKF
jgi:hypothetical protein